MPDDADVLTEEDISTLNEESVAHSAAILRLVGSTLVVAGAIGMLSWLWAVVRTQQRVASLSDFNVNSASAAGVHLVDRVDLFASSTGQLMFVSLVVGLGVASRVLADYAIVRTGGSVTGYSVGDSFPDHEETDD